MKWKWDIEACEFINQRREELSGIVRKAEAELRKSPAFKRLREAEKEESQLSQEYAYVWVRDERIKKFSLEHKPKEIYHANYEVCRPSRPELKEWEHRRLIEYLDRKTEQPVQIYGFLYNYTRGLGLQVFKASETSIQNIERKIKEAEKNQESFYWDDEKMLFFASSEADDDKEKKLTWQRLTEEK